MNRFAARGIVMAGIALLALGGVAGAAARKFGPTLGTPDQIAKDGMAVRLLHSGPVQSAIAELKDYYAQSDTAKLPDADWAISRAAEAAAMAHATSVANGDADRPTIHWSITTAHDWGNLHVPTSGMLLDDPDNVYRSVPIDGDASYVIHGKLNGRPPSQVTFVLHARRTGVQKGEKLRSQMAELGAVSLDQLAIDRDGRFTITVDQTQGDGRVNHLQSQAGERESYMIIRDTLADWTRERPLRLSIERTGGPPLRQAPDEAVLAEQVADRILNVSRYWANWSEQMMLSKPVNTLSHGFARASGWGYAWSGHYRIADDEALIVHLDRRDAAYLGFQTADIWGQAAAYVDRPGSLNQAQAIADRDGTYTYVVAMEDPGVANWVDPAGAHAGTFCARWQGIPPGQSADGAILDIRVVKLADLWSELPPETRRVSASNRADILHARAKSFWKRL